MEDILYTNSVTDIRVREMVEIIPSKDKELTNLIILTILSAGAGVGTPIFNKEPSEIGTKFILDDKEITSDDFLTVVKELYSFHFNFSGLLFEDSDLHTLKVSLINSTIPNLQRISGGANGYAANSITSIIIGNSITEIGVEAFSGCRSLTSVTIPNSVTTIGSNAFEGCTGLTSVTIPNSVTSIGGSAFIGCTGLANVTIGNSVTSIGRSAFYGCTGLTSVTIGNSMTSIDDSVFYNCSGLTSITSLATTAPTINSNTFQNIRTSGTLHVPAGSDYSSWMSTDNYYLGSYNWTKVEDA